MEEFLREYRYSSLLSPHRHCLTVLGDDAVFQAKGYYMFATEYAPFGDLTSNVGDRGVGEQCAKRVARQIGAALEWVHGTGLCHLVRKKNREKAHAEAI